MNLGTLGDLWWAIPVSIAATMFGRVIGRWWREHAERRGR